MEIEALRRKLAAHLVGQGEIQPAYLFDSVTQGRANRLSDINIALLASVRWRT